MKNKKYNNNVHKVLIHFLIATFLLNMFCNVTYAKPLFTDVTEKQWFYEKLEYACKEGIIAGYDDGTFKPNDKLTREQYVKILVMMVDSGFVPKKYKDDTWFSPYLRQAYDFHIVNSMDQTREWWKEPITREEVAQYTYKAHNVNRSEEKIKEEKDQGARNIINIKDFLDISDDNKLVVSTLHAVGVIKGYEDGTFKPKNLLTRAEATSLIKLFKEVRQKGIDEGSVTPLPSDIVKNSTLVKYTNQDVIDKYNKDLQQVAKKYVEEVLYKKDYTMSFNEYVNQHKNHFTNCNDFTSKSDFTFKENNNKFKMYDYLKLTYDEFKEYKVKQTSNAIIYNTIKYPEKANTHMTIMVPVTVRYKYTSNVKDGIKLNYEYTDNIDVIFNYDMTLKNYFIAGYKINK